MLQQTQVATVLPYYRRFVKRFPSLKGLARAPERVVLKYWAGLGYYSRARNLHRAARELSADGRTFPRTPEELRRLPGIGRYTAGAIASIAFGVPAPVVDGNVLRVLSRLFAVRGNLKSPAGQEKLWKLAGKLVGALRPLRPVLSAVEALRSGQSPATKKQGAGDWNQALMELGATVCLPTAPRCAACPVSRFCRAFRKGAVDRYPDLGPKAKSVPVHLACAVVRRDDKILIEKRGETRLLSGYWGLPLTEVPRGNSPEQAIREAYGRQIVLAEKLGTVRHSITHHRIRLDVFRARAGAIKRPLRWVPSRSLDRYVVSSLFKKALEALPVEVCETVS
jgi:A/G-specific adenine glycosylase